MRPKSQVKPQNPFDQVSKDENEEESIDSIAENLSVSAIFDFSDPDHKYSRSKKKKNPPNQ
uniref:Uncharacterized protein n=1 Tax=Cucumis melo TaxID=3656 RepID=A0A9I9EM83_CUCME